MAAFGRRVAKLCLTILLLGAFVCSHGQKIDDSLRNDGNIHREKRAAVDNSFGGNRKPFSNSNFDGKINPKFPQRNNGIGNNPQNNEVPYVNKLQQTGNQKFGDALPRNSNFQVNPKRIGNVDQMHKPPRKGYQIKISDSEECGAEVRKHCPQNLWDKNFMVLDCLQNDLKMDTELTKPCQHFLWMYKRNLTKDERFEHASQDVCKSELQTIKECSSLQRGQGTIISCLIENFDNVTSSSCRQFLNKMATIVFSDYRLIYNFAEACFDDISKHRCGRSEGDEDEALHTQGRTLSCLAEKMTNLSGKCKVQVLRTYELQSDDYHLDRPLYYACREDREHLCSTVTAGGGKVFNCLYKHVADKAMSHECREKIELRQKLISEDVKMDKSFYKACKNDIEKNDCFSGSSTNRDTKRASVLLCLENAAKTGKKLKGKCVAQMEDVRKMLMEDYRLSPVLVARCGDEIKAYCNDKDIGGETLHCLMGLAKEVTDKPKITAACTRELENLMREADVGSDIRVDSALQRACQSVIDKLCDDVQPGDGGVINCLMENVDSDDMTDMCEERLLEIQFFIVRDFRLDTHLYKSCRTDAKTFCKARDDWFDPHSMQPDRDPFILPCLHRSQVSRACKQEIKRVMKSYALSVELNPQVQAKCLADLGSYCSSNKDDTAVGAEMECLQNNYDELSEDCQQVIGDLMEEEDKDIELDHILMKACTPMIKRFCNVSPRFFKELLDNDADPGDVLECLIEHKNNHDMDPKCAAGVEHHQLMTQKDFKFSHKFKEACQKAVSKYCNYKKTKSDVVVCLSEHIRNDTLLDKDHRIEKPCRHQLRLQILQRGESIALDPELQDKCKDDIRTHCENIPPGNSAVMECLKKRQSRLSAPCHRLLFKREKDEFAIADYGLLSACKKMIKDYCDPDDDQPQILRCLKKEKNNPDFDAKCRSVVIRREIMQSKDYRLNPSLRKACHQDIGKFCAGVVDQHKQDVELEGLVISCLKKQYAAKRLSRECDMEITEIVQQAAGDIREAPVLEKACMSEIKVHCKDKLMESDSRDNDEIKEAGKGQVEECLKEKFRQRKLTNKNCIKEVSYLIQEEEIDVNVDPILKIGCQKELNKLCRGVRAGEGRMMSCLLSVLEEDPKSMSDKCRTMLHNRKEMWEYAAQVAPIEGFQEIYTQISDSPAKFYILGVLTAVVCMIFVFGIGCGRVTKRVRAEMKNK
ncbi:Golgi apparatus protein 1-like isoform X2 [Haliotis asinina]|uniref:Golgi apparatus protein 1-like isoform X2 n=1 Tax=Haliotis asinina TaxID=109174 RepID=UPI003531B08E